MKKTVRTFSAAMLAKIIEIIKTRLFEIESEKAEKAPRIKIVGGNHKIGSIPAFNLPPLVTCKNCKACSKHCYACKDYLNYHVRAVSISHARNLAALQDNLRQAEKDIEKYLDKNNPEFFRIHSSGDFAVTIDGNKYAYALMWYGIAKRHPNTRFWLLQRHMTLYRKYHFTISIISHSYCLNGLTNCPHLMT